MAEVKVLIEGRAGTTNVVGTITLIKSSKSIVVDTGNVGDSKIIAEKLFQEGLSFGDIDFVVNTHWHSDHNGNNGFIENAAVIDFHSINKNGNFEFWEDEFVVDNDVKVIKTLGHSPQDISIVVNSGKEVFVVAGDIFENEKDHDGKEAMGWSANWNQQLESRKKILSIADWIIPGHGKMFKVSK